VTPLGILSGNIPYSQAQCTHSRTAISWRSTEIVSKLFDTPTYIATCKRKTAYLIKDKVMGEFSEHPTSWKIILEPMTGNVAITKGDALMCVVLSTVEKHMPNRKLVGATECTTL
jgi:hypothetical protein